MNSSLARAVVVASAVAAVPALRQETHAQGRFESAGVAATDAVHLMLTQQVGARVRRDGLAVRATTALPGGQVQATVRADLREACEAARKPLSECPAQLDIQAILHPHARTWVVGDMRIERANDIDVVREAQSKEAFARGDVEAAIRLMRESMTPQKFASLRPDSRTMLLEELTRTSTQTQEAEACTRSAMQSGRLMSAGGLAVSQCDELRARRSGCRRCTSAHWRNWTSPGTDDSGRRRLATTSEAQRRRRDHWEANFVRRQSAGVEW